MLNFGSNTLMPETTLQSPGSVNAVWLSYCPGLSLLQEQSNLYETNLIALIHQIILSFFVCEFITSYILSILNFAIKNLKIFI